ncbi:MAG: ABC transporter permease [Canibacter sp.]
MFLALRDIRHAPGRFTLIAAVIALMMLLVGFLTGLTGGLASQNISALVSSNAKTIVAEQSDVTWSWANSAVSEAQAEQWAADASGTDVSVTPLGVTTVRLTPAETDSDAEQDSASESSAAVTLFATPSHDDGITLNEETAEALEIQDGEVVSLAGHEMTATITDDNGQYSHTEVAGVSLETYQHYMRAIGGGERYASVLLVSGDVENQDAVNLAAGTQSQSLISSLMGLESFKSEIGTLALMIGMLFGISALIVGVFFLVWSMQRKGDVSVLKALGASNKWLRRDAVGQAALVLVSAILIGTALALGLGSLIAGVAPFVVAWWTIAPPAVAMFIAGLIGSLVSLRQITRADPLVALNQAA